MKNLSERARTVVAEVRNAQTPQSEAIQLFRDRGLSKVESMACLIEVFGVSPSEAKTLVHESPTWSDRKQSDDDFHDELVEILKREPK